jgi:hypothetical protein
VSREHLADARTELVLAVHRFVELTHRTPLENSDSELLEAADAVDDACGELLSAVRDDRRHGERSDRADA